MKEDLHLHLFTKVEEGLPTEIFQTLEDGILWPKMYFVIYNNEHGNFDHFGTAKFTGEKFVVHYNYHSRFYVTHWLDLSKLTTKERAKKAVECGMVHDDERVKSEGFESLVNEAIKEL